MYCCPAWKDMRVLHFFSAGKVKRQVRIERLSGPMDRSLSITMDSTIQRPSFFCS